MVIDSRLSFVNASQLAAKRLHKAHLINQCEMNRRARAEQFTQNIIIRRKKKKLNGKNEFRFQGLALLKGRGNGTSENTRYQRAHAHPATQSFRFRHFVFRKYAKNLLLFLLNFRDSGLWTDDTATQWHDTIYSCTIGPKKKKYFSSSEDVQNFWMKKTKLNYEFEYSGF